MNRPYFIHAIAAHGVRQGSLTCTEPFMLLGSTVGAPVEQACQLAQAFDLNTGQRIFNSRGIVPGGFAGLAAANLELSFLPANEVFGFAFLVLPELLYVLTYSQVPPSVVVATFYYGARIHALSNLASDPFTLTTIGPDGFGNSGPTAHYIGLNAPANPADTFKVGDPINLQNLPDPYYLAEDH